MGDDARQCLAIVYDKLGRHTDAEAELAKIKATDGDTSAYAYVGIYAQWGDRADALEWLNTAMRTHDPLQRRRFIQMPDTYQLAARMMGVSTETAVLPACGHSGARSRDIYQLWVSGRSWPTAVGAEIRTRVLVGAIAFVTLMILEVALSMILFHRSISEYLSGLRSPAGAIGLAAQVCFAAFPLLNVIACRGSNLSSHAPL